MAQGLLPAGAAHSLQVVPTQLYGLLICLLIAGASWATRHRAWPAGNRYLLGVGAVLLAWGGLCQWRDPASQTLGAAPLVLGGVRLLIIQWVVLGAGLLHLGAAFWLLRCGAAASTLLAPASLASAPRPVRQLVGVAVLLALTAALAPHALTGAEFRVLQVALGAVLLAELVAAWPLWAAVPTPARPRMALASLALLGTDEPSPRPHRCAGFGALD